MRNVRMKFSTLLLIIFLAQSALANERPEDAVAVYLRANQTLDADLLPKAFHPTAMM
jgi:hypothetical protein